MLALAGGLLFTSACVTERSPLTGRRQAYAFSWSQEQQMGKEANEQIIRQYGLYNDPELQAYVQRVGERVLAETEIRDPKAPAEYQRTPFKFQVLDSPIVNAFALPGGYIYVTRGLLAHAENEAQLAVVLGHEIGHVVGRHAAKQALRAQVGQVGLLAGAILGQAVLGQSQATGPLLEAAGSGMQLFMLKYGRDAEREADQLGVKYAETKGYDAAQGAGFFRTLKRIGARDGLTIPSWLSSHPDPGARETAVIKLAQQYDRPNEAEVIGEDELLAQLDGMVIGDNPREGFVRGNTFYHPELAFQFPVPQGWKIQNEKDSVMLADPQRRAVMVFELAPGGTAREAAAKFANAQGVKIVRSQNTRINGADAVALVGQANTQQGTVGLLNYFIERGGRVYSFAGLTSASRLNALSDTFERVVSGFNEVRDRDVLNVEPTRLAVMTVDRAAPFSSFIPTGELGTVTPEDLAILNQVELNQTIPAGTKIKVPRGGDGTSRTLDRPPSRQSRERR
jgi:predicted Zn-dependent protease